MFLALVLAHVHSFIQVPGYTIDAIIRLDIVSHLASPRVASARAMCTENVLYVHCMRLMTIHVLHQYFMEF